MVVGRWLGKGWVVVHTEGNNFSSGESTQQVSYLRHPEAESGECLAKLGLWPTDSSL